MPGCKSDVHHPITSSYHIPSSGWLDPDPNVMPHARDHWDNYQQLHWHKYLRHQKVGHLGGDLDTKKRIQSRIQNVPKSTPSWVIVIMMGVCKWNLTSKELPYIPMQWYLIYRIIWHCITLCEVAGPGLLIPKPKTTPSIHRWVYETWLSVAIPELSSTQHLLPEPTKQVCVQNIRNDTRLK